MGQYFQPLRRRFGVITLLMACLFAAGWVRSFSTNDLIAMSNGDHSYRLIRTSPNWIGWTLIPCTKASIPAAIRRQFGWYSTSVSTVPLSDIYTPFGMIYFQLEPISNGFNYVQTTTVNPHLIIPYFILVVPLTLLSVWLLLSKPKTNIRRGIAISFDREEIAA